MGSASSRLNPRKGKRTTAVGMVTRTINASPHEEEFPSTLQNPSKRSSPLCDWENNSHYPGKHPDTPHPRKYLRDRNELLPQSPRSYPAQPTFSSNNSKAKVMVPSHRTYMPTPSTNNFNGNQVPPNAPENTSPPLTFLDDEKLQPQIQDNTLPKAINTQPLTRNLYDNTKSPESSLIWASHSEGSYEATFHKARLDRKEKETQQRAPPTVDDVVLKVPAPKTNPVPPKIFDSDGYSQPAVPHPSLDTPPTFLQYETAQLPLPSPSHPQNYVVPFTNLRTTPRLTQKTPPPLSYIYDGMAPTRQRQGHTLPKESNPQSVTPLASTYLYDGLKLPQHSQTGASQDDNNYSKIFDEVRRAKKEIKSQYTLSPLQEATRPIKSRRNKKQHILHIRVHLCW